ncbi:MAG: UvrD-helicase domain-containing protein [candidate division KSB1 bacterium]|nr:UvrD-helicase domain-containing protein [candidate division KSB1 bacterium]
MKRETSGFLPLKTLNSVQRQAVENIHGPNLILAGAGSGKTRVLTHKIAYLIKHERVNPENILAMTFTNKAAREMKERVEALLKESIQGLWIGTFHSIFARILRKNCEKIGYRTNFVIYDEADQIALLKTIISELNFSSLQHIDPKTIQSKIKYIKNANIPLSEFKLYGSSISLDVFEQVYLAYQQRLQQNNAFDFEDLLIKSIELFRLFPPVLDYYQNLFEYILVDEYQDTNRVQYQLIKILGQKHRNISVVGDDDQSIYRWRGADVRNILEFERDYPDCTIFRLEQNYRSTANILATAHCIISHNHRRMKKQLWTKKEPGEKVQFLLTNDPREEALSIAHQILEELPNYQYKFSNFAILYRTNAQSRVIEDVLKNYNINYVVIGGIRFYDRKEVKDILAYLKVLANPSDSISLKRIINYPVRGIGDATIKKLEEYSLRHQISLFDSLEQVNEIESISSKTKTSISDFYNLIKKHNALKTSLPASDLITSLIDEIGILSMLKQEGSLESLNAIDNIRELLTGINEFINENPHLSLEDYLENISLISDIDKWDAKANAVSLLTLHSAKGLEFPIVFIAGLEEGLFPLTHQLGSTEDLEEERRLFYVGATRAKEKLFLSAARSRHKFGETFNGTISRFINEIDSDLIDKKETPSVVSESPELKFEKTAISSRYKVKQAIAEKKSPVKLAPGSLVKHPTFGKGVVHSISGSNEHQIARIIFEEVGIKKIVLKYCNLEIL